MDSRVLSFILISSLVCKTKSHPGLLKYFKKQPIFTVSRAKMYYNIVQ